MNFGFWNINKKKLGSLIGDFVSSNQLDVLILTESAYSPDECLTFLGNGYRHIPCLTCEKIHFFVRFEEDLTIRHQIEDYGRISAIRIPSNKYGTVTLIAVHYNSKVNWSNEDQSTHVPAFKSLIDRVEKEENHHRTIICGDFNMNPFDFGMVQSTGLHSVMEKRIAEKRSRIIENVSYMYFYNPMWAFLGDEGKGNVSGSLYYSPSKPINYHWHLYDQVLIRPDLIPDFDNNFLDIVTKINSTDLLTRDYQISGKYSDHLPLIFSINI